MSISMSAKDRALNRLIIQAKLTDDYAECEHSSLRSAVAQAERALRDTGSHAEQLLDACHEAEVAFVVCNICDDLTPQARGALRDAWKKVSAAMAAAEGTEDGFAAANPELYK